MAQQYAYGYGYGYGQSAVGYGEQLGYGGQRAQQPTAYPMTTYPPKTAAPVTPPLPSGESSSTPHLAV